MFDNIGILLEFIHSNWFLVLLEGLEIVPIYLINPIRRSNYNLDIILFKVCGRNRSWIFSLMYKITKLVKDNAFLIYIYLV